MMTLSLDKKKSLRAEAKKKIISIIKDKENLYQRQNLLIEKIENHKAFRKAKNILTYFPLADEFDLSSMIISNPDKNWFLPRPIGDSIMLALEAGELHELQETKNKIKVPAATNKFCKLKDLDLVITPAVGFDNKGYRLGRGGGYYDRLFSKLNPKAKTIGVIFEELIIEELAVEEHDMAVDEVLVA